MVQGYYQNHETSGNILVPLLVQEQLLKWQYIAFIRAYLDTILKVLIVTMKSISYVIESLLVIKLNRIIFVQ